MTTENSEGKQITPDLDQAMREGQAVFDGTIPPDGGAAAPLAPGKTGPDGEGEAAAGAAAGKGEDEAAAGKGGAGDDEARRAAEAAAGAGKAGAGEAGKGEGGEGGAAGKKEGDTPPGTAPRFKSHEEAEKGYRELQGKTTKAEQRAKALEDELDRIKNADKIREEEERRRTEMTNFAAERRTKALEDIDGLDPEDGEYRKKAAKILAQADIDIFEHYQARPVKPAAAAGTGDAAGDAAGAEGSGVPGKDADMERVVGYTQEKIVSEGLEKDDPLFWQYAGRAPVKDDKGEPTKLDDQIRWAVDQTKQYHNRIQAKARSADEAAAAEETRRRQAAELPLGRGTAGGGAAAGGGKPPAEEIKQPISLSDAIDAALDQRRL